MAEGIAESSISARIEGCARCFKGQEAEPAGAGCPGHGRHYGIQSRDELAKHEQRRPISSEGLFRSAIMGVRVSRGEAVDEVQDLVTPPPPRLIPHPVSQHTGNNSQEKRMREAQVPVPC
jgi:hypothetical protein